MLRLSIEMAAAPARSRLPLGVVFSGFLSVWLATASSAGTKVHLQAGGEQPVSRLLDTTHRNGMAQGCAAAQVRSGERGRHAVYLESAVQRTRETPKTAVTLLSKMPRGLRHCARLLAFTLSSKQHALE